MTVRNDIWIDWTVSPRIITVRAPSVAVDIQDLSDTIRKLEGDRVWAMTRDYILDNEGKFDLGNKLTGISLRLVNALLAFEARPGPTWAECAVSGGNLAAVDDLGAAVWPISFTNFTSVTFESDVSAALISGSSGLTPTQETQLETAATESTGAHTEAAAAAIDAATAATEATGAHTEATTAATQSTIAAIQSTAAAVDAATAATESTSANTQATAAAASSATAASEATAAAIDASLARKLDSNKAIVSLDDLTVTVYDDDDVSILYVFDISADKRQRIPQ